MSGLHKQQRYLTLPHLAKETGLGERFLRDAVKDPSHPLPCYRINHKTILVSTDDFDQWVKRYRVDKGSAVDRIVDEVIRGL